MFKINGFSTFRLDRDRSDGGLLIYVDESLPSKLVKQESIYEGLFIEVMLEKQKWLISSSYNLNENHLKSINLSYNKTNKKKEKKNNKENLNCQIIKKFVTILILIQLEFK